MKNIIKKTPSDKKNSGLSLSTSDKLGLFSNFSTMLSAGISIIETESEFLDKIKSALTYPAVIFVVFIGVLLTILIVVIPKISTVFSRLNVELPLPTKILVFVSNIIVSYTAFFLIGVFLFIAALFIIYKTNKKILTGIIFALPLISGLVKQIDLVRFTRSLNY